MLNPFGRRSLVIALLFSIISILAFLYLGAGNSKADDESGLGDDHMVPRPAGKLILDGSTGLPAVMPMTMNFVRTPDDAGPDGKGRFLIAVNSGYGLLFNSKSKPQQTLSVIDLNAKPDPVVVQNIYFPSPQSANVGLVFDTKALPDGTYHGYLSGGFENKIWIIAFDPNSSTPLAPANKPDTPFKAPYIDVTAFAEFAPSTNYNGNAAAVYPTGLAVSPDGTAIYSANNLGDTLGIVSDIRATRRIKRIGLRRGGSSQMAYPYQVKLKGRSGPGDKIYVSLWGDGSIAVVNPRTGRLLTHISVGRHPTVMEFSDDRSKLFVVNSDGDSVSVIDTLRDRVIETISIQLTENQPSGESPEGLAFSADEKTLYVANAHSNSVAVVSLADRPSIRDRSKLIGSIPAGVYASAVAIVGGRLFIANGKGTGADNSSNIVNESGKFPNLPNINFPGAGYNKRGIYSVAAVSGNVSVVDIPDEKKLFEYTQQVLRINGLIGREKVNIFPSRKSPFKHVIYIIRENRTYDQIFGDLAASGDGNKADGVPDFAIFGASEAAKSPGGKAQNITPNARALALRFGLLDRFFVNAEASPDGHNWSTAAFSTDYVDKAFRWNYSGRGRTYDYEGFNRLPSYEVSWNRPPVALAPVFDLPATENDVATFLKKYVPYLNGGRDIAEPESLYLWDAAKRAGLTYRNYGEFIGTVSAEDVQEVNTRISKKYPDVSPNLTAFGTKRSLEGHFAPQHRNFDQNTPDSFTTDSYRAWRDSPTTIDPAIYDSNPDTRFRGNSRYGTWSAEFKQYVADLEAGRGDMLPNLSIVRLSNDHTAGLHRGVPTPQFYVAENDYAIGRIVQDVSNSPYWKDTAIFIVEDDAQDGPDHVDAHRSPALVISAYNRQGTLIHEFHSTVSLIRTMELCLGIEPMNFLDANAAPIDIFGEEADLRPFHSVLPTIALDNLYPPEKADAQMLEYMRLTERQDLSHADMANPRELNEIIWFSVRGNLSMPSISRLPAFGLLTTGIRPDDEAEAMSDEE